MIGFMDNRNSAAFAAYLKSAPAVRFVETIHRGVIFYFSTSVIICQELYLFFTVSQIYLFFTVSHH